MNTEIAQKRSNLVNLGIGFGLIFPVLDILLELISKRLPIDFYHISRIYISTPSHGIILMAPVILGAIFYYVERKLTLSQTYFHEQIIKNEKQWHLLNHFITNLDNGKLETEVSDEFENQNIALLLNDYKQKLIHDKQDEEIRLWESTGIAQFGELLRSASNLKQLSDDVIKFIVKYTNSNQGSVFIVKTEGEENQVLELNACYAYHRKKYISSTITLGEGLVGQCYLEQETIKLLKVPENYIKITSGLGEATPRSVILVPMKSDNQVEGVIELASFTPYKEYMVQFLEKIAYAFGATVHAMHTNENVKTLLESSQQQTEVLRTQEEEMRQNLEEIQAIQEQLSRQLKENIEVKEQLQAREKVLGLTTILSETDIYGTITYVNSKFCEVTQYETGELIGKSHNYIRHSDMPKELFKLMWNTIKSGMPFKGVIKNRKKDGSHYWVDATVVPIVEAGKIIKYIGARYHIEDDELAERMYADQMHRLELM